MNLLLKKLAVHNKIFAILILALTSSLYAKAPDLSTSLTKIQNVYNAPNLKLFDIDEEEIDLKDLKGKIVVVNFWATWCPPCRREMPSLQRLYNKTKEQNVVILAVNVGEDGEKADDFLANISPEITFSTLLDTNAQAMKDWKVQGLPSTFIVNKKGQVVYKAIGGREFDDESIVKAVIKLNN